MLINKSRKNFAPIYSYIIIVGGDKIIRNWDHHSDETVTQEKHYRMWKWMLEFLCKIEIRGVEMGRDNSIYITKFINLL